MDDWEPSILRNLSTSHTVIVFDKRGIGNTTVGTGTNPFSIQQAANDTAGLLEGLQIQKADILGYSQGSFTAQQLAVTHPEKINRLILVAATCGGKQSDSLKSPFIRDMDRHFGEIFNSSTTNNVSLTRQDIIDSMNMSEGSAWLKSHPNLLQGIPERQNVNVSDVHMKYSAAGQAWTSPNWSGVCDKLTKISSPTLIISGTDDNAIAPANSLLIASKIPGAWSVHIKDAGHSIMNQYPAEVAEILNTFLSTTSPNN
jgi:pimeloyl-ACP methyl ester carboxylesterase